MFKSSQKGVAQMKKPAEDAKNSTMPKGQKPGPLPDYPKGCGLKPGKYHK